MKTSYGLDDDLELVRYCVEYKDDVPLIQEKIESVLKWRSENVELCSSAAAAVENAMSDGKWDYGPVRDAAPFTSIVNKYITPSQILTTTSSKVDLVYCIRAGKIDDISLMSEGK